MHLYGKVLIVTILLTLVTSMGVVAVSAQTGSAIRGTAATSPVTNPVQLQLPSAATIGSAAAYKTPTTLCLFATKQSIPLSDKKEVVFADLRYNGFNWFSGQPVQLYVKVGTGSWTKAGVPKLTGTGATAGLVMWQVSKSTSATVQFYATYTGTGTFAAAQSNVVKVKFENTRTTPYFTAATLSPVQAVVPTGTEIIMYGQLASGVSDLSGRTLAVQVWTGTTWQTIGHVQSLTGGGWNIAFSLAPPSSPASFLLRLQFAGASPYAGSTSNTAQIIWR